MITQGHGLDKRPVSSQERARERLCDEKLMEDPSRDRLDVLLDRARAVFESKYGKSTDCFAAFSPAKVVSSSKKAERKVFDFGSGRLWRLHLQATILVTQKIDHFTESVSILPKAVKSIIHAVWAAGSCNFTWR